MKRGRRGRALDRGLALGVMALALGAAIHAVAGSLANKGVGPGPVVPLDVRERANLEARLTNARLHGMLVVADGECRLMEVPLPSLAPARDLGLRACSPAVSSRTPSRSGWFIWRRPPLLVARCAGLGIEVAAPAAGSVRFVRGCAPAWRPDGTLTYVRGGEVTHFPHTGRARVVLARHQLDNAFGADRRPRVREVAWATDDRLAALIELDEGAAAALAVFVGGRLVGTRDVPPGSSGLAVPPRGEGIVVLERPSGRALLLAGDTGATFLGTDAVSASWSSDGRWLALARSHHLDLVEVGGSRRVRLPLAAEAVAWR